MTSRITLAAILLTAHCARLTAQEAAVERERAEYARWLATAPVSPLAAVALAPVGAGIRLGPAGSELPLAGVPEHRVLERNGRLSLEGPGGSRPLVRGRPVPVGSHTIIAAGAAGRTTVVAYSPGVAAKAKPPAWYPYNPTARFTVVLDPPKQPGVVRVLAADGTEVEAAEAGTVTVVIGGQKAPLTVRRIPGATPDESELEIYFRDRTNAKGTYPAGRFVALVPDGDGRWRLDFNRARNPFCAYSSVYPCPAPWRGNSLPVAVEAGERYAGGGLDPGAIRER
jgi:uncharacterized protein